MFEFIHYVALIGILILLIVIFHKHISFKKHIEDKINKLIHLEEKVNTLSEGKVNQQSQPIESPSDSEKKLLSDLKGLFEVLANQNNNIQQSVERIATVFEELSLSQDENSNTSTDSQDYQPEQDQQLSQGLQAFCNVYNSGQETQLQTNYQPSYQIHVSNALERRQNPNITPFFETTDRGKLWVFYIEDEKVYAVVPSYGLTLERSVYGPGGFSVVFECPDFDFNSNYRNFKMIRPGILKPDSNHHQWTLIEKGELDLGTS